MDLIEPQECILAFEKAFSHLKLEVLSNVNDQNYLRGIMKFSSRVEKLSKPKLSSCFHSFGSVHCHSARITTTSSVKKARRGKIHVQPEAVKRRKIDNGSKSKQSKGQRVRNNPFALKVGQTKRKHKFAENVRRNEPVAKKAGRTMATRTRCCETTKTDDCKHEA